jgi:hypothetical protein
MQKLYPPILQIILDDLDSKSQSYFKRCCKTTRGLFISHLTTGCKDINPFGKVNIGKLKYLCADHYIYPDYYPQIEKMTNLYSLVISDMTLNNKYSYDLISKLPLRKLKFNYLISHDRITNSCIMSMVTLTELNISNVPKFSNEALINLKNIERLDISGHDCKITGKGIKHLKLTHLDIGRRTNICFNDIKHLSNSLTHLNMNNCPLIYPKELGDLKLQSLEIGGKHVDLNDLNIKSMQNTLTYLDSHDDNTTDLKILFGLSKLQCFKVWWNEHLMKLPLVSQLDKLRTRDPPVKIDPENYNQLKIRAKTTNLYILGLPQFSHGR